MAVKTEAQLISEWEALGDARSLTETDWLEGMRSLQAGGSVLFPMPSDGSSTSVSVGESWTLLNPWTVSIPGSGKGVTASLAAGTLTIETGGDGWYACRFLANCSIAGITQACELAMRATRGASTYIIQGARIDVAGVLQNISIWGPSRLESETPVHFVAGDVLALYGRTGPSGGTRTLTINSATLQCERKLPSS